MEAKNMENKAPDQQAGNETQGTKAEKAENISEAFKRALGKESSLLFDLENGGKVNVLVQKKELQDYSADVNQVTAELMNANRAKDRFVKRIPVIGMVANAVLTGMRRHKVAKKYNELGDISKVYEYFGLEDKSGMLEKEAAAENRRRARLALEESGFEDTDSGENMALIGGEEIKKSESGDSVNAALVGLFEGYKAAESVKFEDDKKMIIEAAEDSYKKQIEQLKKDGKLGIAEDDKGNKLRKLSKWLGGDAAKNEVFDLSELNEVSNAVKELAKHDFSKEQVADFLKDHVSLYNTKMKEGLYKEAKADGVYQAMQVAGTAGAIAASLFAYETKSGAKSVLKKTIGGYIASRVLVGAAAGAAMGAVTGALRGNAEAGKRIANAEREAALSGEKLMTKEERDEAEKEKQVEDELAKAEAERAEFVSEENGSNEARENVSEQENETGEIQKQKVEMGESNISQKERKVKVGKVRELFEKFVQENELVKGKNGIEGFRKRESAKDLYDKLDELLGQGKNDLNTRDIIEVLADIRARNGVSNERKIDLIAYSKGNVAKERRMLVEKMIEAEKFLDLEQNKELKDELQEETEWRARTLNKDADNAEVMEKDFKRRMRIARGVQGALIGGATGAAAGAIYGAVQHASQTGAFDQLKEMVGLKPVATAELQDSVSDDDIASEMDTTIADVEEEIEIQNEVTFSPGDEFKITADANGDGYFGLKIGDQEVLSGNGAEDGIQIDMETGELSEESVALLQERGINAEYEPGTTVNEESVADYFKVSDENRFYISKEELSANANDFDNIENYKAGYSFTEIERQGFIASDGENRAADIVNVRPVEEGIAFNVRAVGNVVDSPEEMDALKVVLTADSSTNNMGIVLDVSEDGSVVIPAGSPAAQMFSDGYNFSGNMIQVVRGADGGGFEVLSSAPGADSFASMEETFFVPGEMARIQLTDANGTVISENVNEALGFGIDDTTSSGMVSDGEVNINEFAGSPTDVDYADTQSGVYTANADEGFSVDGIQSSVQAGDEMDRVEAITRTEDYVPERDPYNSIEKMSGAFRGPNLTEQLAESHNIDVEGLSNNEVSVAVVDAVERGDISTGEVVNAYLSEVGDSPEQLVEMRAMLGDLHYDIDGDGQPDLIDDESEINTLANILKDGSDPDLKYKDFANETFNLFRERINGGEIKLINYAEQPYNRTTLGFLRDGDIRTAFAEKKSASYGIGLQFLTKDGKTIYDEDVVRKVWRLSPSQRIDQVTERLNCCQKTARVSWLEQQKTGAETTAKTEPEKTQPEKTEPEATKVQPEKTEPEATKTEPEKTQPEKTEPEKTQPEKTQPEKTEPEKTEPEKTEDEKTEPEKTDTEKTEPEKTEPEKTEDEKTEPEKTDTEKTEPEKTEPEKTESEDTDVEPKTDTNPWEDNNPEPEPTTPEFEEESDANGGAEIIQEGEENLPPAPDDSGVNENPADQQDWSEEPTQPEPDTGTGGTEDMSPDTDEEAAEMLRQAEEAARAAEEAAKAAEEAAAQNVSTGGGANAA